MMERFLDIHMFITAALEKTDMRAVGLQLAMDLLYKKVKSNSQVNVFNLYLPNFIE
jgi:hypothetical protein